MRSTRHWIVALCLLSLGGLGLLAGCGGAEQAFESAPPSKTEDARKSADFKEEVDEMLAPHIISTEPGVEHSEPAALEPVPRVEPFGTQEARPSPVAAAPRMEAARREAARMAASRREAARREAPRMAARRMTAPKMASRDPAPGASDFGSMAAARAPDTVPDWERTATAPMMRMTEPREAQPSAGPDLISPQPMLAAPRMEPDEAEAMTAEAARSSTGTFEKADGYTKVRVFYGTDRAPIGAAERGQFDWVSWLKITLILGAVTVILMAVVLRLLENTVIKLLATLSLLATIVTGVITAYSGLEALKIMGKVATTGVFYGSDRGQLELGVCDVAIPAEHAVGELEAPSVLRLEFKENPEDHVVLMNTESVPAEKFFAECRNRIENSRSRGAFVFIHGYNVKFDDAARRTAQIAYDLHFDGAPIFYSWPSQGTITGYMIDENNVRWTVPHLRDFLTQIAKNTGAKQIHLIAHSMGNRALTSALRDLSFEPDESRPEFHEVVLTAPDIDAEVFKRDIVPAIVKTAKRVTLYASSNDKALAYSKTVHGYPRAGDTGGDLLVIPGIDTIDVSAVDTSLLGHTYYGDNDTVLTDLFALLNDAKPPEQRVWLRLARLGRLRYWIFQR